MAVVALGIVSLAVAMSYESPCRTAEALPEGMPRMKAIVARCYGSVDVLKLEEIAKPAVGEHDVLVKVHAAAVNPLDYHFMTGKPYILRISAGLGAPDYPGMGVDFAGVVEVVGKKVTRFKVGDEVFGGSGGALGEYVIAAEAGALARKPASLTFEQAAAVPVAAITALQGLRDKGRIQSGDKVLINGASGGVGTFAVQIAKSFGAEVTGVCSTRNLDLVRSIGADHVIDYTNENFTEGSERYDLILDNVGNHSLSDVRRAMKPDGVLVIVGVPKTDPWFGQLARPIKAMLLSPFVDEELVMFISQLNAEDLTVLGALAQAGKLEPVIDRRYTLSEVPEAIEYLQAGHARGKVIINVAKESGAAQLTES